MKTRHQGIESMQKRKKTKGIHAKQEKDKRYPCKEEKDKVRPIEDKNTCMHDDKIQGVQSMKWVPLMKAREYFKSSKFEA